MLSRVAVGGLMIALAGGFAAMPAAQTPQDFSALLMEIRLVRQSIETMAATQMRVQLLFARLEAQENRVSRATGRLQATRLTMLRFNQSREEMQARINELEAVSNDPARPAEEAQWANRELKSLREEVVRFENASTLEADALRQVADEERILADLRKQVEDLERTVAKNPK